MSVICAEAKPATNKRPDTKIPKTRMARYASGERDFFKRNRETNLRGKLSGICVDRCNPSHYLVTPEVINQRIASLNRMKRAVRLRPLQQIPQLHESMTSAARIKGVKRNRIFSGAFERLIVRKRHRCDSASEA